MLMKAYYPKLMLRCNKIMCMIIKNSHTLWPQTTRNHLTVKAQDQFSNRIDDFIHRMNEAENLDRIFAIILHHIQLLEFERFAYWLIRPPEGGLRPLCLTNYAESWTEHYTRENMANDDYVGMQSAISVTPFTWHDVVSKTRLTRRQRMVFTDSADAGMRGGATIPLHGPGNAKALLSVAADMPDAQFEKLFADRRHEIQIIATYAHAAVMKIGLHKLPPNFTDLTPREIEVLTWAAKGKSRWETSIIIDIKEDTVKTHLENARGKLNASNTTNAIAIAIVNGLIYPVTDNQFVATVSESATHE